MSEIAEMGGLPMIQEDKDWITNQFNAKVAEVKLEMVKEIAEAVKELPCSIVQDKVNELAVEVGKHKQQLSNGKEYSDKLDKVKSDNRAFGFSKLQLVIGIFSLIGISNIPWGTIFKLIVK